MQEYFRRLRPLGTGDRPISSGTEKGDELDNSLLKLLAVQSRPFNLKAEGLVSQLSKRELEEFRDVVNAANRKFPRVFPQDRLGESHLAEHYAEYRPVFVSVEGHMVGGVLVHDDEDRFMVNLLAVLPEFQGQGFGQVLVGKVEQIARSEGKHRLILEVVETGRLVSFYQSLGFTEASRETMPIGKWNATEPFELVTMEKEILAGS